MKKRLILMVFFTVAYLSSMAQSAELRAVFNKVCETFKNYNLKSEDVQHAYSDDMFKTKTIDISISNQNLIISFNDGYTCSDCWSSKAKTGKKSIKVSFSEVQFTNMETSNSNIYNSAKRLGYVGANSSIDFLKIKGTNGLEYKVNGQKEILNEYSFYATELTVKKVIDELQNLKRLVLKENFRGQLGGNTQKSSSKQNDVKPKKIGEKYEQ